MVVTTQYRGRRIAGLFIGSSNVARYFSRDIQVIELHLDHLHIQCRLSAQFWEDKPEIVDSRLSDWLRSKHLYDKSFQSPIPVEMIPAGQDAYRLGPAIANRAASANVSPQASTSA